MTTTVATPVTAPPRASIARRRRVKGRRNYLGGLFAWVWLAIIIIPIYYVVITTFKDQGAYFTQNPARPAQSRQRSRPTRTWSRLGSAVTSSTR